MATAKKLPSGSWRCQVYSHTEELPQPDGTIKKKRIYKSFTCDDPSAKGKRKCEAEAAQWAADKEYRNSIPSMALGQAIEAYIAARESILSPCTVRDYRGIRKNSLASIMDIKLEDITQEQIQKAINIETQSLSPKTVRNIHGLVSAVLGVYRPDFALHTVLPKKVRPGIYVPSDSEIKRLMEFANGTEMELPILLAAFGPMRRGEICALEAQDIQGNVVHVCRNMVRTPDCKWIIKTPKSYAGDRYIEYPDFVAEKFKGKTERIVPLNPSSITDRFARMLRSAKIPHFRFHDLRHYSASVQHAIGIPDAYIMQRGGWGNDGVLKNVYRHVMEEKEKEMNKKANDYFSGLCNTKCNTKTKNP